MREGERDGWEGGRGREGGREREREGEREREEGRKGDKKRGEVETGMSKERLQLDTHLTTGLDPLDLVLTVQQV